MGLPLAPVKGGESRRRLRRGGWVTGGETAGRAWAAPSHPPNTSEEREENYSFKCAGFAVGWRRIYPSVPAAESIRRGSEGSRGVLDGSVSWGGGRGGLGLDEEHGMPRSAASGKGAVRPCQVASGGDGAVDTDRPAR